MRQIVISTIFVGGAVMSLCAQVLYREPLWRQFPIEVLPTLAAPVTIEDASYSPGGTVVATVRGAERHWLTSHRITLRFGSRLDAHAMLSFRVRPSGPPKSLLLLPEEVPPRLVFELVRDDGQPSAIAVTPKTRAMVTIDAITDAMGRLVYENTQAAQQLWHRVMTP